MGAENKPNNSNEWRSHNHYVEEAKKSGDDVMLAAEWCTNGVQVQVRLKHTEPAVYVG